MSRLIEVPDWCIIGQYILWSNRRCTGFDWVKERIIGYSDTGFFHRGDSSCPVYHTEFSEFGKTVKLYDPLKNSNLYKEGSYCDYV